MYRVPFENEVAVAMANCALFTLNHPTTEEFKTRWGDVRIVYDNGVLAEFPSQQAFDIFMENWAVDITNSRAIIS